MSTFTVIVKSLHDGADELSPYCEKKESGEPRRIRTFDLLIKSQYRDVAGILHTSQVIENINVDVSGCLPESL